MTDFKSKPLMESSVLPLREDFLGAKVVSFDLFDTLIYRKSITHYQMWKNVSYGYFFKRAGVEVFARLKNRIKGNPEVSQSDIYDHMPKNWGLEFEINLELENLLPNPVTLNLLKQASLAGASVCIISDTHYREPDIKRFLTQLGMPNVMIFTSGEYKLTKSTGLFQEVQKQLGVTFENWIHIGDNYHSDILSAKKLGVRSFHYPSMKKQLLDSGLMSPRGYIFLRRSGGAGHESLSRTFTNLLGASVQNESKVPSMMEVLGSVLGDVVACSIVEEIHQMHVKNNYDCILYSSRDGWLPFLAHSKIYPDDQVKYFKTSRRMLWDANFNNYLVSIIGGSRRVLLYDLGWRGTTSKRISKDFSKISWDFVYWQLLGKRSKNQHELNPGKLINRLRIWRSRDFLESIFTDPSEGFDKVGNGLIPIERMKQLHSGFKHPILKGAQHGIACHLKPASLKIASLTLEAVSRYPSNALIAFAQRHTHQINEVTSDYLVTTTWKNLFSRSRILWPFGSKLYLGNKISGSIFAKIVFIKETAQRVINLIHRFHKPN